ncbi:hypothetical protein FRB93_011915 [Tulasnella sp. JGI-2019a]|nr:hypothetical protein FRB93_011915 [Tulasnella sp. JGI-2019a]
MEETFTNWAQPTIYSAGFKMDSHSSRCVPIATSTKLYTPLIVFRTRSRNVRIIFIPAFLLVLNGIGFTIIVVIDFLLAVRPNNLRYPAINHFLFILVFSIALAYTSYITIFIAGRLWWVGSAANKFLTPEEKKRNRYQGAINALVQSGVIYSITAVLTIISVAIGNVMMIIVLGCISPVLNGISATLLVLQLNMYQGQTKRDEDSNLPLTTGASFRFAAQQGASSSSDPEWAQSPVIRRRRASTATCQYRDYKDTGSLPVTFIPAPPTNAPVRIPTLPYSPTNPRSEGNEPSAK